MLRLHSVIFSTSNIHPVFLFYFERTDCQYTKGPWSTCSATSYTKSRTLALKAGQNETKCQKTKTVEKKCKKGRPTVKLVDMFSPIAAST